MDKKEITRRYILFIISLFFSALGIAFAKSGGLGVSPISSVANVMSIKFSSISLGNWLIIWNCIMIAGQIVLLRKNFKPIQLLQIPVSFLFGYFTDLGMIIASVVPVNSYIMQLVMVLLGVVILGFGVALAVIADVVMNSGEALVKAIADVTGKVFGNVKIAYDVSCVAAAIILSLIMFDFKIVGTREGTVIAAVGTGMVVNFFTAKLKEPLDRCLSGQARQR